MKYAKGIMWLDDCRIPFVDDYGDKKGNETNKQKRLEWAKVKRLPIDQFQRSLFDESSFEICRWTLIEVRRTLLFK